MTVVPEALMDGVIGLAATAQAMRTSASEVELLRQVIQASDDFDALVDDEARREFIAVATPLTGDGRYDALLAGLAVHLCRRAGLPTTPAWTRDESRYLDRMWWFGLDGDSGLQACVFQRTPSCMRSRGVLFNADNLASV